MEERQNPLYYLLLGVSAAISILAVVTLIPNPAAAKPNVLGYRSVCSFAPAATALCALLAGATCVLRNRLVSVRSAAARYQPPIAAAVVAVAAIVLAAVFGARFGAAQARFQGVISRTAGAGAGLAAGFADAADGTRTATAAEGDVSATVEVTVSGSRLVKARLVTGVNMDAAVAERLFREIMGAQSTAVDAVAGATASSNVLLRAVEAAAGR
jgi:uncharacterized protein with FMN-binding domain